MHQENISWKSWQITLFSSVQLNSKISRLKNQVPWTLRRGIVPYFFVTITVIVTVIMILAMFIFYFCLKQQDKHCIRHYDCDYDCDYDFVNCDFYGEKWLKDRICILLFCHSHSHSHSHCALCNVYPVALDRNRR